MPARAAAAAAVSRPLSPTAAGTLPAGIRSRVVTGVNGIAMHVLEAGFEAPGRPGLLLVHGFPELGYSWRKVMLPLAAAGYHVMAPDQRGYGRSGGTDVRFDDDLAPFSTLNRVRDMLALTAALGHRALAGVVGHDFGSPVAAWCALTRPDVFHVGRDDERAVRRHRASAVQHRERAGRAGCAGLRHGRRARQLSPPRKHYQTYYTTREANDEHVACAAGPARVPARLLPRQERRLAGQRAASAGGQHRRGVREAAALLRDGPGQGHGRANVHLLGVLDRRLHAGEEAHGAQAHVEVEAWRSATFSNRMPPPTGVVSGPLMPTRYSRNAVSVSSGSQLW